MKVTEEHTEAQENKDIVAEIKRILGKEWTEWLNEY